MMPRCNHHTQLVHRDERAVHPYGREGHEPDINDAAHKPLPHFLHRAFKQHHFHLRILLLKTSQHTGEHAWTEAQRIAHSQFPDRQAVCSLCCLLDRLSLCQERTHVGDDRLADGGEGHDAFAVALEERHA